MKLLTKAWYQTMLNSGLGVMLEADERAAVCAEAVYQTLRAEKLEQWLREQEELCELTDEPFHPDESRRLFEEYHCRELEIFRTQTPAHILEKVADIRMLALGYCTAEVYADFKEYRDQCRNRTEKTLEEAFSMCRSQGLEQAWTGEHSLHDSLVLSLNREGEDLIIEFEREDPMERLEDIRENDPELLEELGEEEFLFPEIRAIRFREARILKQEQSPEHAWWLYDEIWRTEAGAYEIHALLWRDDDIFELTIACRDTELVWTVPPKTE